MGMLNLHPYFCVHVAHAKRNAAEPKWIKQTTYEAGPVVCLMGSNGVLTVWIHNGNQNWSLRGANYILDLGYYCQGCLADRELRNGH